MKKQPKNWLVFSGLAFQIGIIMYLMVFFRRFDTRKMEYCLQLAYLSNLIFRSDFGVAHHYQKRQ